MTTKEDDAWVLGFFEGEGCLTANQARGRAGAVPMLSMQQRWDNCAAVEACRAAMGNAGKITRRPPRSVGTHEMAEWRVYKKSELMRPVEFFDANRPRFGKGKEYDIWRQMVLLYLSGEDQDRLNRLGKELQESRQYTATEAK